VLEDREGLSNVIILQTVLEEVRHRSTPVFKRLKDIIAEKSRKFYVFINEHHVVRGWQYLFQPFYCEKWWQYFFQDTYVDRKAGESANDRNDRAIRSAAHWYNKHIKNADPSFPVGVVLISNDFENRAKALEIGLKSVSIEDYVKKISKNPYLADKLLKCVGNIQVTLFLQQCSKHQFSVFSWVQLSTLKLLLEIWYHMFSRALEQRLFFLAIFHRLK